MEAVQNLISVKNLVKTYRMGEVEVQALRDVSLDIGKGAFAAIMGPSGSGKSTFMNILGCLDYPTKGDYYLEGMDVFKLNRNQLAELRNLKFGFIFQSFNLLPRTTAIENVELPMLYNNRLDAKQRKEKALAALRSVGLEKMAGHKPNQLSGGQQQRVAIARSLVNDPVVIMADEPTGNLDTRSSYEIMEIFQQLNEKDITVIMVTHEMDIARFAKVNILFRDGKIESNEQVKEIKVAKDEIQKLPVINPREVLT
jgi:putative ABC transport system ATP-binding protein